MDAKRATIGAHGLSCIRSYSEKIGIHVIGRPPASAPSALRSRAHFLLSLPLSLNYGAFTALVRRLSPGLASSICSLGLLLNLSWTHWSTSTSILFIFAGDFLRRP